MHARKYFNAKFKDLVFVACALLVGHPGLWLVLDISESQLLVPQFSRHQDVVLGAVRLGKNFVLDPDVRSSLHDDVAVPA